MKNVTPILFLLTATPTLQKPVLSSFIKILGPVSFEGCWQPFNQTQYYREEMGENLSRRLIGFENLLEPSRLGELKKLADALEQEFCIDGKRQINIDPGYLDLFKVVLATHREGGQRIAVAPDIYADPLLRFDNGKWNAFSWTFPDFKSGIYDAELTDLRNRFKLQVKPTLAHPK